MIFLINLFLLLKIRLKKITQSKIKINLPILTYTLKIFSMEKKKLPHTLIIVSIILFLFRLPSNTTIGAYLDGARDMMTAAFVIGITRQTSGIAGLTVSHRRQHSAT